MNKLVVIVCARLAVLVVLAVLALLFMPAPPLPIVYGPIVPNSYDVISGKRVISTCGGGAIYIQPGVHSATISNNDIEACK